MGTQFKESTVSMASLGSQVHRSKKSLSWNILRLGVLPNFSKGRNSMERLAAQKRILLPLLLLCMTTLRVHPQSSNNPAKPDELFRTVASLDSALFEAYNSAISKSLARS